MKVALFGGTGFIGSRVLEELLVRGHEVRALARDPSRLPASPGLTVVTGDAADPLAVSRTVSGCSAVISALGTPRGGSVDPAFLAQAMGTILECMSGAGVRRVIAISGAAISSPGDSKPLPHRVASALVRLLQPVAVASKQREYETLAKSGLNWTAVRPTRVDDRPSTGRVSVGVSAADLGLRVSRIDLAQFMVDQLDDETYQRQAPFISSS